MVRPLIQGKSGSVRSTALPTRQVDAVADLLGITAAKSAKKAAPRRGNRTAAPARQTRGTDAV